MLRYGIKIERSARQFARRAAQIAKKIKRNHERASSFAERHHGGAVHCFLSRPTRSGFSAADARQWAASIDSWDIVDGVSDLFVDTDAWKELIEEFAARRARVRSAHVLLP